ncbi:MAG: C1 family peptidase, partial [Loigolactobacillus coryniformis]
MSQEITSAAIADYQSQLQQLPQSATVKRAVMNNGILAASENTDSKVAMNQTFSVDLSAEKVANQKQSGRCWMFAALNTMRRSIADQFNLKDFELSQNYTNFWDKFEKSNYFY